MHRDDLPYTMVVPSQYGSVLVNRYDTFQTEALVKTGAAHDAEEIRFLVDLTRLLPDDAVIVDVGANLGLFSIALAQAIKNKGGKVIAFEAQRIIFNMLCGSLALNCIENVFVHHLAVSDKSGWIDIPKLDYNLISSFGSVEFGGQQKEYMGQQRSMSTEQVRTVTLDEMAWPRVDMLKMDIEGMEELALRGGEKLFSQQRPIVFIEWTKSDKQLILNFFAQRNYQIFDAGMNLLCMPKDKEPGIVISDMTLLVA